MADTERSFTVSPSVAQVLDYLKDFSHAQEWDPGTQSCSREDTGPIAVGSRWHNVSKFAGRTTELAYTLQAMTDDHLVFVGVNKGATSTDDISLRRVAGGTEITYHAHIEFHGIAKLAGPFLGPTLEHLGDETEAQLTDVLNRLAS